MSNYYGTPFSEILNQIDLGLTGSVFIYGMEGDDQIFVKAGSGALGGPGNDKITGLEQGGTSAVYWESPSGIVADMDAKLVSDGYGGVDTLVNVSSIAGSRYNDVFRANVTEDSYFFSSDGNDNYFGASGFSRVNYGSEVELSGISYDEKSNTIRVSKKYQDGSVKVDQLKDITEIFLTESNKVVSAKNIISPFVPEVFEYKGGAFQIQGINWSDYNYDQYSKSESRNEILSYMKSINANSICIDTHYMFNGGDSTVLQVTNENFKSGLILTKPSQEIISLAKFFSDNGIKVNFRVYLIAESGWILNSINSTIESGKFLPESFFRHYKEVLLSEAKVAQSIGAEVFSIGSELGVVTSLFGDSWKDLIAEIRGVYNGKITYAANFNMNTPNTKGLEGIYNSANEAPTLSFGKYLDYIGLDIYSGLPLDSAGAFLKGTASIEQAMYALDNSPQLGFSVIKNIRDIYDKFGKKIVFMEGGWNSTDLEYQSLNGNGGPVNDLNQANIWQGQLLAFKSFLDDILVGYNGMGEFPWSLAQSLAILSRSGSVQGKLAQNVFSKWYSGQALYDDFAIRVSKDIANAYGFYGDDEFEILGGTHTIVGGAGVDTVVYQGAMSEYVLNDDIIRDRQGSSQLTTNSTLIDVERLRFSDLSLALDLDGNAGITAKILGVVAGKQSLLNRQYVGAGLDLLDNGMSYTGVAALALVATGLTSNEQIVDTLWTNIFGSAPSLVDRAPLIRLLEDGLSRGEFVKIAAETDQNAANIDLVGLSQTGIEYWPVG